MILEFIATRPLRIAVLTLALFAAGVGVRGCEPYPSYRHVPAVAWDGRGYLVAWAPGAPGDGAVVVQHFDRQGAAVDAPWEVFRDPKQTGPVALVRSAAGFLLVTHRLEIEEPRDTVIVVTQLDHDGRAIRGQSVIPYHAGVCSDPAVAADGVTLGMRTYATGPFNPTDVLWLVRLTHHGVRVDTRVIVDDAGPCSMAIGRDGVVVLYRKWRSDDLTTELRLVFDDGHDVPVVVSRGGIWPLRLVATPGGYAILYSQYADEATRTHLALIDPDGALERTLTLPDRISRASHVDLGVSARGLFVSWAAGGRVRVMPVDDPARRITRSTGRDASDPVAFGHDDRCVTVWVASAGKQARMIAACP